MRRWTPVALVAAFAVVGGVLYAVTRPAPEVPGAAAASIANRLFLDHPLPRDVDAYRGLATWVDVYDFAPEFQGGGAAPPVTPSSVDAMAAAGVRTIFLQAARPSGDSRAPGTLVDSVLLGEFLVRAHRDGLRVVGWYLPSFADVTADLARVDAIADLSLLGHRFDGVAVDIEATDAVPDPAQRNLRLIALSTAVRSSLGTETVGAIVLPPVQLEVVNPNFWPAFPWRDLAPLYNVWLPMSYWTYRKTSSGYHDGYTYNEESTRRLRADLGDAAAAVHAIGGIGDLVTPEELQRFAQSLVDTGAVGGSIYDWNTLSPADRDVLRAAMAGIG